MRELITGGDGGIAASEETQQHLARKGVEYAPRATGQHVAHIDRRIAFLCDISHRAVEQLKHEKLDVPFSQILSQRVFAGSAR
eukprot:54818-Alexandrium_andersonii.AAC.1